MVRVGIFRVGYIRADISYLCRLLNRTQTHFHFENATAISNMGDPDLRGYGYSNDALVALLKPHMANYEVCVVTTSVPIEDNYFTQTVGQELIISTSYEADELVSSSKRTLEEYIALAICQELVSFEFQRVTGKHWRELFHQDTRGCIFDFAGLKEQKIAKLISCRICPESRGQLHSARIDQNVLAAVESILAMIRRPSIRKAWRKCLCSPGLSFVYGGVIVSNVVNLFSAIVMNQGTVSRSQRVFIILLFLPVILVPALVYFWMLLRYLLSRED